MQARDNSIENPTTIHFSAPPKFTTLVGMPMKCFKLKDYLFTNNEMRATN